MIVTTTGSIPKLHSICLNSGFFTSINNTEFGACHSCVSLALLPYLIQVSYRIHTHGYYFAQELVFNFSSSSFPSKTYSAARFLFISTYRRSFILTFLSSCTVPFSWLKYLFYLEYLSAIIDDSQHIISFFRPVIINSPAPAYRFIKRAKFFNSFLFCPDDNTFFLKI